MTISVATANIRMGPGTNYEVLWKAERYYPVVVLKSEGEWAKFKDFEGDEGWIHQSLLSDTKAVVVKKEKCNIRSGPGTDHAVKFVAGKGVPFKVLKKNGNWIQIRHSDGDTGWIYHSLVW
ncbi:MAG: SH3 domain-containing protein [Thermodesulfobacteriota bacterium]|nr:SH3 domain-containing protein [Thermodesulfobacteriota bacterium]